MAGARAGAGEAMTIAAAAGRLINPRIHIADRWPEYGLVRVLKFSGECWPAGVEDLGWMSVEEYEAIVYVRPRIHPPPFGERQPAGGKIPISEAIRWEVWERDDFRCKHCGRRRRLSIDHIQPESKGGTLDLANLQTLCGRCNSRKGDRA